MSNIEERHTCVNNMYSKTLIEVSICIISTYIDCSIYIGEFSIYLAVGIKKM